MTSSNCSIKTSTLARKPERTMGFFSTMSTYISYSMGACDQRRGSGKLATLRTIPLMGTSGAVSKRTVAACPSVTAFIFESLTFVVTCMLSGSGNLIIDCPSLTVTPSSMTIPDSPRPSISLAYTTCPADGAVM